MSLRFAVACAAVSLSCCLSAQRPIDGVDPDMPVFVPGQAPTRTTGLSRGGGVVLPASMATSMGNSNNFYGVGSAHSRYQQVFEGAQVGSSRPLFGHAYRMRNASYRGGTQTLEIKMSLSNNSPANMSTTFASNISGSQTTVFKADFNYPPMTPNQNPTKFAISLPWTGPWVWSAGSGNHMLIEILNSSAASLRYFVDAHNGDTGTTRLYNTGGTRAVTGTLTPNYGLVMCFATKIGPPLATYQHFGKGCPGTGGKAGVIVPASMRTQIGNGNNIYGVAWPNQRYQQIFDGGDVGPGRTFTAHAYRAGPRSDNGLKQQLVIKLSATKNAPIAISPTFANNITSSQTTVVNGTIKYPDMVPSVHPSQFKLRVPWSAQFVWTAPANEHLLMEVLNSSTVRGSYYANAHLGDPNVARCWSNVGTGATTGKVGLKYGLCVCFEYSGTGSGTPILGNTGRPITGQSFTVDVADAKASTAAFLIMGVSNTKWGTIPLPLDLTGVGAKGCSLLVSFDLVFGAATNSSGVGSSRIDLPNNQSLWGLVWHNQWGVIDQGANALQIAFSNGGSARVGGQ